jgi:kynureninase
MFRSPGSTQFQPHETFLPMPPAAPTKSRKSAAADTAAFKPTETHAKALDKADPLASFRDEFHLPTGQGGKPLIYFAGNSLGLMPKSARACVEQELDDWATYGVDGHFKAKTPWYSYHETFRELGAGVVGARLGEVVMMNSLTINLHLLLISFYRPTRERFKIIVNEPMFPSDLYALQTHLHARGQDPRKALLVVKPRKGEHLIHTDDVLIMLDEHADEVALVFLDGINYYTGQMLDIPLVIKAAHGISRDLMVGFDMAHAAGSYPIQLHDWNVDFAAWCSYKYLNGGPGAVGGVFIHERHGKQQATRRFGGWWGNDPVTRMQMMHLQQQFVPVPNVEGWQVSNPPILSLAPLTASLKLFEQAGMDALRTKSLKMTAYLRELLAAISTDDWEIITPSEPQFHGCQLSILVKDKPQERFKALEAAGVACDFRPPNVVRIAPVPLYNSFHDCWRFAQVMGEQV